MKPGPARGPGGWCQPCHKRCLPTSARIATPGGDVVLAALREGMIVWSLDAGGARVAVPIARMRTMQVERHMLLRVALDDGRRVVASPEHPMRSGAALASLGVGDALDGARVVAIERVPYDGDRIRDLLPASDSGAYWADGVLLGSTLSDDE